MDLVKNLPEVKNWLALFTNPDGTSPKTGGKIELKRRGEEKADILDLNEAIKLID